MTNGGDVQEYDTRDRDVLTMHKHRIAVYEQLPSQVGVKIINPRLCRLKELENPKQVESQFQQHYLTYTFYSVGECIAILEQ